MATAQPPDTPKDPRDATPQGDIRRGGWILILIGVVLLLAAAVVLILL